MQGMNLNTYGPPKPQTGPPQIPPGNYGPPTAKPLIPNSNGALPPNSHLNNNNIGAPNQPPQQLVNNQNGLPTSQFLNNGPTVVPQNGSHAGFPPNVGPPQQQPSVLQANKPLPPQGSIGTPNYGPPPQCKYLTKY